MNDKQISFLGLATGLGMVGLMIVLGSSQLPPGAPEAADAGDQPGDVARYLADLPPTAAGAPALGELAAIQRAPGSTAAARPDMGLLGGSAATGRVARVYVRAAEGVLIERERVPAHLRQGPVAVEVEFPDALKNGAEAAHAYVLDAAAGVEVGDVIEVRFAHKHDPKFFPVRELTRMTGLVARRDSEIARAFEQRILARRNGGAAEPVRLAGPQPASSRFASLWAGLRQSPDAK